MKEKYIIFTYVNPRGRSCINFVEESGMVYKQAEGTHYGSLKEIRKVAKYDTALEFINKLAREKGNEIAG